MPRGHFWERGHRRARRIEKRKRQQGAAVKVSDKGSSSQREQEIVVGETVQHGFVELKRCC